MTSKKSESPPRDWEYYQEKFRELFQDFTRDVLVDQADHYMNMVGFTPVSYDPLPEDPHEDWAENEGTHVIVYRYRNAQDMEIDFRFSFNPLAGMDFEIDFEEAGMLMYSGPYNEVDPDLWESTMDSMKDGGGRGRKNAGEGSSEGGQVSLHSDRESPYGPSHTRAA